MLKEGNSQGPGPTMNPCAGKLLLTHPPNEVELLAAPSLDMAIEMTAKPFYYVSS